MSLLNFNAIKKTVQPFNNIYTKGKRQNYKNKKEFKKNISDINK